jgi:hypothetical protein
MSTTTAADVRGVLKAQGAPAGAVDAAEAFEAAQAQIRAEQYRSEREAAEVAKASAACVDALRAAIANAEVEIDARLAQALDAFDRDVATRARENRKLSDVVDVGQLRTSSDVAEILRLVDAAERAGVGSEAIAEAKNDSTCSQPTNSAATSSAPPRARSMRLSRCRRSDRRLRSATAVRSRTGPRRTSAALVSS